MMNQTDLKGKLTDIKGRFKGVIEKFTHRDETYKASQADGVVESDADTSLGSLHDFDPDREVRENDDASMPDKSYAFDEETTDADYDLEDDFEFEDETEDDSSGQTRRYS